MSYVLMLVMILLNGYVHNEYGTFDTLAECETTMKGVVPKIADYNAGDNPNKIVSYAVVCLRPVAAPQGKSL